MVESIIRGGLDDVRLKAGVFALSGTRCRPDGTIICMAIGGYSIHILSNVNQTFLPGVTGAGSSLP